MKSETGHCDMWCRQKGEVMEQVWEQIQPRTAQHGFSSAPGSPLCLVVPHQALLTDLHYLWCLATLGLEWESSLQTQSFSYLLLHNRLSQSLATIFFLLWLYGSEIQEGLGGAVFSWHLSYKVRYWLALKTQLGWCPRWLPHMAVSCWPEQLYVATPVWWFYFMLASPGACIPNIQAETIWPFLTWP